MSHKKNYIIVVKSFDFKARAGTLNMTTSNAANQKSLVKCTCIAAKSHTIAKTSLNFILKMYLDSYTFKVHTYLKHAKWISVKTIQHYEQLHKSAT